MPIELIEKEIQRFLSSAEPEVLCISGEWGIGKTFAWNKYLDDAHAKQQIALPRYAYVSLFGVNSLDELRYLIFENTIQSASVGSKPNLASLQTNTAAATERLGRSSLWFLRNLPLAKNYVGGLGPIWFFWVSKSIICFDDLERRGGGLSIRDVFGLAVNLKEQKQCKIALILNSEALSEEKEKKEFQMLFEKAVDVSVKFAPMPEECTRIALPGDTTLEVLLAENCVALGISNIRVIKKIERAAQRITPLVRAYDPAVLKQAVQSLTLLGWSIYEPAKAPPLEYLKKRTAADALGGRKDEKLSEQEAAWNALLEAIGFSIVDEFDLELLAGVQNGYFDEDAIKARAVELDERHKASKGGGSFSDAWREYHDSFDDNQEHVLDRLYESFMRDVRYITPINLNGTVRLFKQLGRCGQAVELIVSYIQNRRNEKQLFDLENYPFSGEIDDTDVIAAFRAQQATYQDDRPLKQILMEMKDRGFVENDLQRLAEMPVAAYFEAFKGTKGADLRRIISASLQFDRIANASDHMKEIAKRAREALTLIGQESPINARRVKAYGVTIEHIRRSE